jgi:protein TIF31
MGKSKNKNSKSKRAPNRLEHLNTVPDVIEVVVKLPKKNVEEEGGQQQEGEERAELELQCVSTDTLVDVRIMLSELPETCHVTNYALQLEHATRGEKLKSDLEVMSLKSSAIAMVEEPYASEKAAVDQVNRFADLFTCTNLLGPVATKKSKPTNSWLSDSTRKQKLSSLTPSKIKNAGTKNGGMWEEPLLEEFYSYFSFADLASPVEGVELLQQTTDGSSFFELKVKGGCEEEGEGETFHIVGCENGFFLKGKGTSATAKHKTIVDLLKCSSKAFRLKYNKMMESFKGRNQFGNPPLGLRCNTWAVPPCFSAKEEEGHPELLPAENSTFNGDIGGALSARERHWHAEFAKNADMPGHNPAERVARDHRVFLLHSHFVDTAITTACGLAASSIEGEGEEETKTTQARNFNITTKKEQARLTSDCGESSETENSERLEKSEIALIKGLLADENTIARDVDALAKVHIHFNGMNIKVEANKDACEEGSEMWPMEEEPALNQTSALNVHGLRKFCHTSAESLKRGPSYSELNSILLDQSLEECLTPPKLRWEIAFAWIQNLKNPPTEGPGSLPVKYGMNRRLLLGKEGRSGSKEGESELREKLGEAEWNKLAKLNIDLHRKTINELKLECNRYYAEIALPRIIYDFGSLELSPIDGQTLTDFMHSRGINMRHIGRLAILSKSLMHIHSLCIQEMVVRAAKRIIRAVMSKCSSMSDKAAALAGTLNCLLGAEGSPDAKKLWDWIHLFVKKRFDFTFSPSIRTEIRHLALLRDLCQRVGIEIASKSYDFCSESPFSSGDVVAVIPVCKHIQFTSADGRQLLEQAKAALDKGKLDEAVTTSTSALSKMCAVCGSHSHATANAFSLLAVVLYHTGDFLQAAIYQQKALAVNEREYGLDHPDTIKSYGDLAVFFYRLQHTELALHYVSRALYLLHLTCGSDHPNTAATYINVAMMEESLDNVHVALRYLQEALHCNQKLLGPDHVQTAASYHAIAIALSLMDPPLYTLSVQHEQTTLDILEQKLGPDDLRTQDAAAWLEYFDLKAVEAQEALKSGNSKPDCNIACKGHLPVKDLMKFIFDEEKKSEEKRKESSKSPDSILYELSLSESASGPSSVEGSSSQEDMSDDEEAEEGEEEMSDKEEEILVRKVLKEEEILVVQRISHEDGEGEWVSVDSTSRKNNRRNSNSWKEVPSKKRNSKQKSNSNAKSKSSQRATKGQKASGNDSAGVRKRSFNSSTSTNLQVQIQVNVQVNGSKDQRSGSSNGKSSFTEIVTGKTYFSSENGKTPNHWSVEDNNDGGNARESDVATKQEQNQSERGRSDSTAGSNLKPSAQAFYPGSKKKADFNPNAESFVPRYMKVEFHHQVQYVRSN